MHQQLGAKRSLAACWCQDKLAKLNIRGLLPGFLWTRTSSWTYLAALVESRTPWMSQILLAHFELRRRLRMKPRNGAIPTPAPIMIIGPNAYAWHLNFAARLLGLLFSVDEAASNTLEIARTDSNVFLQVLLCLKIRVGRWKENRIEA
ncbi:hypothetical protein KCU61_g79, partial [Aureobasidium melanogenum]